MSQVMPQSIPPIDVAPGVAPSATARSWRDAELSNETSHGDLLKAILGETPRSLDDRHALIAAVDAQVKHLRDELGLPEPVVEPPAPAAEPEPVTTEPIAIAPPLFGASLEEARPTAMETTLSVVRKVPGWLKQVTAQARQKR